MNSLYWNIWNKTPTVVGRPSNGPKKLQGFRT